MVEVNVWTLLAIAGVTSIGNGIGTPIGNWIYKKFLEHRLDSAHEKIKEGKLPIPEFKMGEIKIDTQSKIDEMLGKR